MYIDYATSAFLQSLQLYPPSSSFFIFSRVPAFYTLHDLIPLVNLCSFEIASRNLKIHSECSSFHSAQAHSNAMAADFLVTILTLYIEVKDSQSRSLARQSGTLMAKRCGKTPLSAFCFATPRLQTSSSQRMRAVTVLKQSALKMAGTRSPYKRLHHF